MIRFGSLDIDYGNGEIEHDNPEFDNPFIRKEVESSGIENSYEEEVSNNKLRIDPNNCKHIFKPSKIFKDCETCHICWYVRSIDCNRKE